MNYYTFLCVGKYVEGRPTRYVFAGWYPSFVKTHQAWALKETLDIDESDHVSILHVKRPKRLPAAAIREITDTAKSRGDIDVILAKLDSSGGR